MMPTLQFHQLRAVAVGLPVIPELPALQPADQLEHYRRGQPDSDDAEAEARAAFGLGPDDPFPDFSGIDKDLLVTLGQFQSPPGTYFDAYPIMLVSTQTLTSLGRRSPGSKVDVRRFRPNLVVDAPSDEEFPELCSEHPDLCSRCQLRGNW